MIRRPPRSTRTDTLFPYTTLFRSFVRSPSDILIGKEVRMKRLHVHVGVADLDQSIRFYSTLFASEPTVVKPDYAKWMLDDPRVNFAISANSHAAKGIEHLGIQVESQRSEERRVGQECVSTCRYRGSPYH